MTNSDEIYYILTELRRMKKDKVISAFKFCYDGEEPKVYVTPVRPVEFVKLEIIVINPDNK